MFPLCQKVLLGLICLIFVVFLGQIFVPELFDDQTSVPRDLAEAWNQLISGNTDAQVFQTLSTTLSATLMHGSWDHIIYNMLFLWVFAGLVGELLGTRWMLAIFLFTAIAGYVGDAILRSGSVVPALGASGAVMGFEGAYLGLAVRWSLPKPKIWPIAHPIPPLRLVILAGVGFALDISGAVGGSSGIAHGAHLGGFLGGLFLTSFVVRSPRLN
ncbi:MAG: rhomboid family intramembrane serine protease [Roseibacillus sp.]